MGNVNLPASADQILRDLTARVKVLEAAVQTRVPMNTITGGPLQVQDAGGNVYMYVGRVNPNLTDGSPQYGILGYRQNGDESVGTLAFSLYNSAGTPPQTFGLWDAAGNVLWTDDGLAGQGIGRPYLELGFAPSGSGLWESTSSGSYGDLYYSQPPHQHPKVVAHGIALVPTGVTAGLQLVSNGSVLGSPISITGAAGAQFWTIGPVTWPGTHATATDLRLQAAVTGGSGTIQIALSNLYGRQS